MFKNSRKEGSVARVWEKANIMLAFKKGIEDNMLKYRQVSLISTVGKLLLKIIRTQLVACS